MYGVNSFQNGHFDAAALTLRWHRFRHFRLAVPQFSSEGLLDTSRTVLHIRNWILGSLLQLTYIAISLCYLLYVVLLPKVTSRSRMDDVVFVHCFGWTYTVCVIGWLVLHPVWRALITYIRVPSKERWTCLSLIPVQIVCRYSFLDKW